MTTTATPDTIKHLSQKLFFLASYSLTAAALMGSSIGLIVYQSRQFFFLNRYSQHNLLHTPFRPSLRQDPADSILLDHQPHEQYSYHHHHHHDHHHRHHALKFLFFSSWLPVLVWIGSLLLSSFLFNSRKWVPRCISARTGILSSQFIFSFFWIMLGAVQEVQERLISQRRASRGLDPILEAMDDSNQIDVSFETKSQIRATMVPLCTIWYLAVVLLGVATGLLTASSSLLEKQLEQAQQDALLEEVEKEKELYPVEKVQSQGEKGQGHCRGATLCKDQDQALVNLTNPSDDTQLQLLSAPSYRYTTRQRATLVLLILGLFSSQMRLFKWIIKAQSLEAYNTGTATSISTCLTLVGLVSGAIMVSLGARFLPRMPSRPSSFSSL